MVSSWNVAEAKRIVSAFMRKAGLCEQRYNLIRFRQNALFHLPDSGLTIRIYNPDARPDRARFMVLFARWLETQGFPAVRPAELLEEQPVTILGCEVTTWKWIKRKYDSTADAFAFGQLLRRLHDLTRKPPLTIPELDPLSKIRTRLDKIHDDNLLAADHFKILEDAYWRAEQLAPQLRQSNLGSGLIHGDALRGNAIQSSPELHLIDFDSVCFGPREWDLVPTAIEIKRFRRGDLSTWNEFLEGYDVTASMLPDLEAAITIKELSMTVFLCLRIGASREVDDEIDARIRAWAGWNVDAPWHSVA